LKVLPLTLPFAVKLATEFFHVKSLSRLIRESIPVKSLTFVTTQAVVNRSLSLVSLRLTSVFTLERNHSFVLSRDATADSLMPTGTALIIPMLAFADAMNWLFNLYSLKLKTHLMFSIGLKSMSLLFNLKHFHFY
jgi:hypothetical protein